MVAFQRFWIFFRAIKPFSFWIGLSVFIENVTQLNVLLPPLVLRVLFDYAYPYKDYTLIIEMISIPLIMAILTSTLLGLKSLIDLYLSQEVFYNLYTILYSKLQRLPISFFHKHHTGDLMYRLTDDVQVVEDMVLTSIPKMISSALRLILILTICFSINIPLTLIALGSVPLYFASVYVFTEQLQRVQRDSQEKGSKLYSLLEERLSNIKLIKLFHRWSEELRLVLSQVSEIFETERKEKALILLKKLLSSYINRTWAFLVALYMGMCLVTDQVTLGEVVALTAFISLLNKPFNILSQLYTQYKTSQISFERILEIVEHTEEVWEDDDESYTIEGNVTFDNVCFKYENGSNVLNNLSFYVEDGKSIAIVGKSGIGKSSIVDILLRFFEVQSGTIKIGDENINDIPLASIRQQIAVVTQDSPIFTGTIKDNLVFAVSHVSQKKMEEAAKKAGIHDYIESLPNKYDTMLGVKGVGLSNGQRQRLAIARALLSHPKILIFDEATSALDSESEGIIQQTIKELKGKTTVILIAHRFSMVQCVDNVVVIGPGGRVVESGEVVELMSKKGIFFKIYEMQIGGFHLFYQQVNYLIHSTRIHKRPNCVALLHLPMKHLSPSVDEASLCAEYSLVISFLLRESDNCFYEADGRWWLTMPETIKKDATKHCERLVMYLNSVISLEYADAAFEWNLLKCRADDTEKSIMKDLIEDSLYVS